MSAESFGVWRATEVAALRVSDVCINEPPGSVEIKVRSRGNEQFGVAEGSAPGAFIILSAAVEKMAGAAPGSRESFVRS